MTDAGFMRAALALAARGLGDVGSNPAVGCLLVRDGIVLGRGRTQPGGRPHAEQAALAQARARFGGAAGATAYVTLEPCAHHGQTPPCAEALIAAGVARVVAPLADPDPRVAGKGFAMLRAAGVAVTEGVLAAQARAANAGFLSRIERGRPHLTLKLAATLDGRIATASGESRWITGPEARARVHLMRAQSDAILIGAATAIADDPALDVRLPGLAARSPVPVVLEGRATLPATARLRRDRRLVILRREDGLAAGLAALGARGVNRLFCEGGGRLAAALLDAGLVDELAWFSAGAALGAKARPSLGALGFDALADAPRLALRRVERLGEDVLSLWTPRPAG